MAEPLYAIIHEADGDTIWRWQTGRKAKFVEYGGYHRARETADRQLRKVASLTEVGDVRER